MTAQELRVGNLVEQGEVITIFYDFYAIIVTSLKHNGEISDRTFYRQFRYDEIKPIPLTDEWLLKFGFRDSGDTWLHSHLEFYKYLQCNDSPIAIAGSVPIESVHQLQNLYYALTNKELTIW